MLPTWRIQSLARGTVLTRPGTVPIHPAVGAKLVVGAVAPRRQIRSRWWYCLAPSTGCASGGTRTPAKSTDGWSGEPARCGTTPSSNALTAILESVASVGSRPVLRRFQHVGARSVSVPSGKTVRVFTWNTVPGLALGHPLSPTQRRRRGPHRDPCGCHPGLGVNTSSAAARTGVTDQPQPRAPQGRPLVPQSMARPRPRDHRHLHRPGPRPRCVYLAAVLPMTSSMSMSRTGPTGH